MIPQVEREVFVNASKASNEVILEGADGAFGGIAAVDTGWGELEIIFFFIDELVFQGIGALMIVETLEAGTQAGGAKFGIEGLKSGKDGGACAVFDRFGEDAVAVIIVHNDQIIVASAGCGRESAGLVAKYFSGGFEEGGITKVGAVVRSGTGREEGVIGGEELEVIGKTRGWCNMRCLFGLFGGALVLARLVKVAFDHCNRSRGMFMEERWCNSGKVGDEAFAKGKVQSGQSGGE
jgi:hypothetical protein